MGRDKALMDFGGVPLILRIAKMFEPLTGPPTVIGRPARFAGLGLKLAEDDQPGLGPLGGIATALRISDRNWNIVVGCDLPFLTREWLSYLIERAAASRADVLLPHSDGGAEPLCAAFHKRCLPTITRALERGVRKVTDGLADLQIENVSVEEARRFDRDGLLFKNMNSPSDCEEAQATLLRREAV